MQPDGSQWEEPIPRFRKYAAGVGEVHADLDKFDAVSRDLPLEKVAGHDRRWTLALETLRVVRDHDIVESPDDLIVGVLRIPSSDRGRPRTIRIRYAPLPMGGIPAGHDRRRWIRIRRSLRVSPAKWCSPGSPRKPPPTAG